VYILWSCRTACGQSRKMRGFASFVRALRSRSFAADLICPRGGVVSSRLQPFTVAKLGIWRGFSQLTFVKHRS
jgi:hypothetical protein